MDKICYTYDEAKEDIMSNLDEVESKITLG